MGYPVRAQRLCCRYEGVVSVFRARVYNVADCMCALRDPQVKLRAFPTSPVFTIERAESTSEDTVYSYAAVGRIRRDADF